MLLPNLAKASNRYYISTKKALGVSPAQFRQFLINQSNRRSFLPVNDFVAFDGINEWGCNGLFCECNGGRNSPQCKIVAPYCVDDLLCIGDKCSCVWGGGP